MTEERKAKNSEATDCDLRALDILIREKDALRAEVTALTQSIHRGMFAFLIALGAYIGVYANLSDSNPNLGPALLVFTQIEFLFAGFGVLTGVNIQVLAGYIAEQEREINRIVGFDVSLWESLVAMNRLYHWGPYAYSAGILFLWFSSILIGTILIAAKLAGGGYYYLLVCEVLLLVYPLLRMNTERQRARELVTSHRLTD